MTRAKSPFQYTVLGIFVVLIMVVAGWFLASLVGGGDFWTKKVEMVALSPEATEIHKGTPVVIRGLQVGQVTSVEYPADDSIQGIVIKMEIEQKYQDRIYQDSFINFKNRGGLLGNQVLDLNPGTQQAGALGAKMIPATPQPDLAAVTQKLSNVADRADAVVKSAQEGKGTFSKLLNDDELYNDLKGLTSDSRKLVKNLDESVTQLKGDANKTLNKVDKTVEEVRGEMDGLKQMVRNGNEAATSVKQDADAIKSLPIIRGYVEDHAALLVRANCKKERVVYIPKDIFDGDSAILTDTGKQKLDEVAKWLSENRQKESEVVVVSYTTETKDVTPQEAKAHTKKQSEVVAEYLKKHGGAKLGTFSSRKVIPLGAGLDQSPIAADKDKLPPARIEILLFVPQN